MVDIKSLEERIKKQNSKNVVIGEWTFVIGAIGGMDLVTSGIKAKGNDESLYVDVLFKSVVGWENVKVKDLVDGDEQAEEEVPFSRSLFDVFLGRNISIVTDLINAIQESTIEAEKSKAERKKK